MVKSALHDGVGLLGVGAGGIGAEKHRDASCVEGVDILRFVMVDRVIGKGFEVITGSKVALCDHRGAENDTVDGVIQSEVAMANDWSIRVAHGKSVFNIVVDGGSDTCKFPNTGNSYLQPIGWLDVT